MNSTQSDEAISIIIKKELQRQKNSVELIASENFVSKQVLEAAGSCLTNKYAEGYPQKRYYGGCENIDYVENLAIERAKKIFGAKFANVQPHSGTSANAAVYLALLEPNDTVLAMDLNAGGHLSHGSKVSFSAKFYNFFHYNTHKETGLIDYEQMQELALEKKPKMIVVGGSNYSRTFDFPKIRLIADQVDAFVLADMSHVAGLIAAGVHYNPINEVDCIMTTTHKTLRGPRGAIILTNNPVIAKKIDGAVFPGIQGGPLEHIIAAKAVCFYEALQPEFKIYGRKIIQNAKVFCEQFLKQGVKIVANGTDNHLFTINCFESFGITGDIAEKTLEKVNITVNKNSIPYDQNKVSAPSGIRIGVAAMTTRGFNEKEFVYIAELMLQLLRKPHDQEMIELVRNKVTTLMQKFPLNY